jgi:hypothetical protein
MKIAGPAAGGGPATHAFVVGVSHYPFLDGPGATTQGAELGMADLSSAARSASEVTAWLLGEYHNPDAPLADVTLFLSPSEGEQLHPDIVTAMAGQSAPALRDDVEVAFNQFREACRSDPRNVAFVYVVGHGIQLDKHGAVLLLQDFGVDGRNLLYGALVVEGCRRSMDESGNADHQLWFSDACRQRPDVVRKFETLRGAYAPDERPGNVAACPIFLAASTREKAFATVDGTSIFNQALMWALRGGGARGPSAGCPDWHVPATQLITVLPARVTELLSGFPEQQTVHVTGTVNEVVAQRLAAAPPVEIDVDLDPEDHDPVPLAELLLMTTTPQEVAPGWPLHFTGPPGIYKLQATTDGGTLAEIVFNAEPPRCRTRIVVA